MKRKTPKIIRFLMVAALLAGILGALVPVGRASAAVTLLAITQSKTTANTVTQVTATITQNGSSDIPVGGNVVLGFPSGWQIPSTIASTAISVNGTSSTTAPIVNLATRTVQIFWAGAAAAASPTTVLLSTTAGIKTPKTPGAAGTFNVDVSGDGGSAPDGTVTGPSATTATLKFKDYAVIVTGGAKRGTVVNLTGEGWGTSTGVNITIGSSATVRGTGSTDSSGTLTASFTASASTKAGGVVKGTDGKGNISGTTTNFSAGPTYTQRADAQPRSTSGRAGTSVTIDLVDFTALATATISNLSTTLGGTAQASNPASTFTIDSSGTGSTPFTTPYKFKITAGTTTGLKTVSVTDGQKSATFTFTVTSGLKGTVTALPGTVVAGQTVTLTGTSFTVGSSVTITSVSIGGVAFTIANAPAVDSGGSWVAQLTVPTASNTLTPGTQYITAFDSSSKYGTASVTIPERAFTLSLSSAGRGDSVSFTGTGFVASVTTTVTFGATTVATVTAGTNGQVSGSFAVPLTAGIPSTNYVTATSGSGGSKTAVLTVASAVIVVTPGSGASGSTIVIAGSGFPAFSAVTSITIGTINSTPLPAPSTSGTGQFTTSILVPQLSAGTQPIVVTIGTTTASVSFTVGASTGGSPPATALAGLVATGSFEIASAFNYTSGIYEAFANIAGDPLATISPNSVIILTMTADTTVSVSGVSFSVKANVATPIPVGAAVTIIVQ